MVLVRNIPPPCIMSRINQNVCVKSRRMFSVTNMHPSYKVLLICMSCISKNAYVCPSQPCADWLLSIFLVKSPHSVFHSVSGETSWFMV